MENATVTLSAEAFKELVDSTNLLLEVCTNVRMSGAMGPTPNPQIQAADSALVRNMNKVQSALSKVKVST